MWKTKLCFRVLILLLTAIFITNYISADCFTVLVGKKASADGSVLFGHNEQNRGRRIINYRCVPRIKYEPGTKVTLKNGGTMPQVEESWALIWQENPGIDFGDSYFNEWGVAVSSDSCPTREDSYDELCERGDITDGGIGYMLRRLVAQRAKTAREGVKIAGELIEHFGYTSSGRSLLIAGPEEAWVLAIVRGKNWVAQRCPDDEVVLLPNIHIIGPEADLSDTDNVLASPGLKEYAEKRGWYDPGSSKPFSFREAFNYNPRKGSFREKYSIDPRQWYAQSKVQGRWIVLPTEKQLPFSVKPAHKMTVKDVAAILRSHNEGTEFDASKNYSLGSPHKMRGLAANICGPTTQEGAVYQLRSWLPKEIGCLVWRTTAAPCSSVLTPWYLGISGTPEAYYKQGDINEQLTLSYHFDPPAGTFDFDRDFAFDAFNALENLVDINYKKAIKIVRKVWDPIEKEQFINQSAVEETALSLYKKDKEEAKKYLTSYTHSRALLALEKAKKLNNQLKTLFWTN